MKVFWQKLPKNVGDLGKKIAATGFEKLPNLVTLHRSRYLKMEKVSLVDQVT